ncbi:acyl-CoA dehydrogenase family protein [Pseudomonas matsuisoli]|uniref:Acyl-CoA dehydrogenase n=1 Tax=Pseudomonas matsuisoli TaxID=1515666 RepID=A0A917PUI0_9PSED|nr:acyl-CoA dehydrogenase family protein [Pseudomonas matsuisoli]GGJ91734.1 acyl-CoA dehydrogenase [Pseudomonas matsuisoli]
MPIDLSQLQQLLETWKRSATPIHLQEKFQTLVDARLADLPKPGQGSTLFRWQALAAVAGHDLGLVKLYEGHTDALAIITELGGEPPAMGTRWGVWAAEPPHARLRCRLEPNGNVSLTGRKAWCSGAARLSHALVTAWDQDERPQLVAVMLDQPEVDVTGEGWQAVGMAATASVEVVFSGASGHLVGESGAYLTRPGFWQGGAGIAACWYGAAVALADYLHAHCRRRDEPHARAHLGHVDAALGSARTHLHATAAWIDANPSEHAQLAAGRTRAVVESAVETVQHHVGRALGASPFCLNAHFARLAADLPVFVRQSHAERDLAGLAELIIEESAPWRL